MFLYIAFIVYVNVSFIHIPKTGGTAIKHWRRLNKAHVQIYEKSTCNTTIWDINNKRYFGATSRKHCLSNYKYIPKNSIRFCVIRNPIDRAISSWKFRSCRNNANKYLQNMITIGDADNHNIPQHNFAQYCDVHLCYENIQSEFSQFAKKYFPHLENKTNLHLKNKNRCTQNITLTKSSILQLRSIYFLDFLLWDKICQKTTA